MTENKFTNNLMDMKWLYGHNVTHHNPQRRQVKEAKKLPGRKSHDMDKALQRKAGNEQAKLKRVNDAKQQSKLLGTKIRLTYDVDIFSVYKRDTSQNHVQIISKQQLLLLLLPTTKMTHNVYHIQPRWVQYRYIRYQLLQQKLILSQILSLTRQWQLLLQKQPPMTIKKTHTLVEHLVLKNKV